MLCGWVGMAYSNCTSQQPPTSPIPLLPPFPKRPLSHLPLDSLVEEERYRLRMSALDLAEAMA
jgi:hypothetical protein